MKEKLAMLWGNYRQTEPVIPLQRKIPVGHELAFKYLIMVNQENKGKYNIPYQETQGIVNAVMAKNPVTEEQYLEACHEVLQPYVRIKITEGFEQF